MKTRKYLGIFVIINIILYIILIVIDAFAIGHSTLSKDNLWIIIPLMVGLIINLFLSLAYITLLKEPEFYKTYEELLKLKEETNSSWNKAEKFIKIIGNHEAIKLWEQEKDK